MYKKKFNQISQQKWDVLSAQRIFFGHHSVGQNIIDGIQDILKENSNIHLSLVKTKDPYKFTGGGIFAHYENGKNFDPTSKIRAFSTMLDAGIGEKADIAFMKFCFVDIGTQTDVKKLFLQYRDALSLLETRYPGITFIHVTAPLVTEPTGLKAWIKQKIKKILGKNNVYENTAKYEYNTLLRTEYLGKEPLFDLAAIEATYSDGRKLAISNSGSSYAALIPEYTDDGGHLNKKGRGYVARELLVFLANLKNDK